MDEIIVDMPCHLHVLIGRIGNKSKVVAIGMAIPGRVFHNISIPIDYAKVSILQVTNEEYLDYELDHSMPEGIMQLGETVNQFILWH